MKFEPVPVECFGAPVDPGNLLLLAYRGDVPIVGAPGLRAQPQAQYRRPAAATALGR